MYYENLKGNDRNDYLTTQPTRKGAINNANISGVAEILPNSNNRALIIKTSNAEYLQSYDTTILKIENGKITKYWNDYSATTMKHINTFLRMHNIKALSKKDWLSL